MSKKETKNEAPKNNDYYQPILSIDSKTFKKIPRSDFSYYEIRVWKYHRIINQKQFNTLKEARKYYKKNNYYDLEITGQIYVELTRITNLNTYYEK